MNDKRFLYPTGFLRRSWQSMASLVVLFCLIGLLPGTLWAQDYYVDASGGDDGLDGTTEANAWQTLAMVNSVTTFIAGDQILFKRGETWHESLVIPRSNITIGAYGSGELPLFDGTAASVSWTPYSGKIYITSLSLSGDPGLLLYKGAPKPSIATLLFSSNVSAVKPGAVLIQKGGAYCSFWVTSVDATSKKVSGITFFRNSNHWVASSSTSIEMRQLDSAGREVKSSLTLGSSGLDVFEQSLGQSGDWYWNPADKKLYLYSDTAPNDIDVQVSALPTGINSNGEDDLTIQDIAVHGYQQTGVHLHRTEGSTVQRMQISNVGANGHKTGIMLDESSNNIITNNQIESVLRVGVGIYAISSANPSQGNTVSGNLITDSGSSGISLNTDDATTASSVATNTIDGNTVRNSNTFSYDSAGVYAIFIGTGNVIRSNVIVSGGSKELRSAGVMIDQGVSPVIITSNRMEYNSLGGIVVTGSGHTITRNTVRNNGAASWQSAQMMFFPVTKNVSGCSVRNNVVEAETGKYLFLRTIDPSLSQQSNTIDSNTYRSRTASTFCWSNDWGCDGWVNFSTWQNTSGHDANSTFSFITDPPPPDIKSINSTYLLLLK